MSHNYTPSPTTVTFLLANVVNAILLVVAIPTVSLLPLPTDHGVSLPVVPNLTPFVAVRGWRGGTNGVRHQAVD